jgi:peptidoglycan/xylan/chitin deacetylase (PgdA/CDA1 family)
MKRLSPLRKSFAILESLLLVLFPIILASRVAASSALTVASQPDNIANPPLRRASSSYTGAASAKSQVVVRCRGEAFEVLEEGRWTPFFFKGVNLGAAPPGKFPGEFAIARSQYARWIKEISELGANAIRVYTLHPPAFYEALLDHNRRSDSRKIWLFQGAWFELPDDLDLYDEAFSHEFRSEIRSVVDALHGSTSIPEARGHAWGRYSSDVSGWVAGYILGRECEPYVVLNTDKLHSDVTKVNGQYFNVTRGSPTECWFAGMCDFLATYERDKFGWEHPISFASWPTLDPMRHPTETERGGARAYHDEDAASINPSVIHPSKESEAGFFATFHAYPYYPDFMNLDPGYGAYRDEHGFCNYAGYLRDLKSHLRGVPLLIGETGVPTSRGIAHFQPQGLNHGGASERAQGVQDARLVEDCYREGAAGVLIFELFDEWFKDNWLVKDFEVPADRDVLWQNVQDPEEFFGLLAEEPRAPSDSCLSESSFVTWSNVKPFYQDPENDLLTRTRDAFDSCRDLRELRVSHDSRYIYLRIAFSCLDCDRDGKADLDSLNLLIGFDTIDRQRGDTKFPLVPNVRTEAGMEFVLYFGGADSAAVLIDSGYNFSKYSRVPLDDGFSIYTAPFRSRDNSDGKFERMIIETNRDRVDASGKVYPAIYLDVGGLTCAKELGRVDVAEGDWRVFPERNCIEIRIPWAILNVTDPSSRQVLDDVAGTPEMESSETDGMVLSVLSLLPGGRGIVCDAMPGLVPAGGGDEGAAPKRAGHEGAVPEGAGHEVAGYKFDPTNLKAFSWQKWDTASYAERRKVSFEVLSSTLSSIADSPLPLVRARVATWPDDRDAAVSVSFDDGTANQVEYALPILERLGIKATFALCGDWTGQARRQLRLSSECVREQLSFADARNLISLGHEIASHGFRHVFLDTLPASLLHEELKASRSFLENGLGEKVLILHYPFSRVNQRVKEAAEQAGFLGARGRGRINPARPDEFLLQSVPVISDVRPSPSGFADLLAELRANRGWLILTYHNVLPRSSGEAKCYMKLSPDEPYCVTPGNFKKEMEKLRGMGFYVAPEGEVLKYIRARDNVKLVIREEKDRAIIKVQSLSAEIDYEKGLNLILGLPWKKVRVEGSLSDSRYTVPKGGLLVKAAIGSEVIVYRED